MRDYQRKKGKYVLPTSELYNLVIWQIRNYYRFKDMADAIREQKASGMGDGMPHGSVSPDGVLNKAIRCIEYSNVTDAIDKALNQIPTEYKRGVWNNILYRSAFPMDADRSTYVRYKSKFIYQVAEELNLI